MSRASSGNIVGKPGEDIAVFLANLTRSNEVLCFTEGNYRISTTWLIGDVSNLTVTGMRGNTILFLASGTARHLVNIQPTSAIARITFSDMIFDGNGVGQTDASSRNQEELVEVLSDSAGSLTTISFLNNEFRSARGGAALQIGNSRRPFNVTGISLHGNNFHDNGGMPGARFTSDGVHLGGCANVIVESNIFDTSTDTGLAIDSCKEITVSNNVFRNNSGQGTTWTGVGNSPLPLTGFTFTGNVVILPKAGNDVNPAGLTIGWSDPAKPVQNAAIFGNTFDNTAAGSWCIYIRRNSNWYTITGNNIFGGGTGIYFESGGGGALITGNAFSQLNPGINTLGVKTNFTFTVENNDFRSVLSPIVNVAANVTFRADGNSGYNPVGKITNFVNESNFSPWGVSSNVLPSTDYTINGTDMLITCSGGNGATTVKDKADNIVFALPSCSLYGYLIPIGYKINFGAFSLTPTITVFGN